MIHTREQVAKIINEAYNSGREDAMGILADTLDNLAEQMPEEGTMADGIRFSAAFTRAAILVAREGDDEDAL
jgi:hypothetical protein